MATNRRAIIDRMQVHPKRAAPQTHPVTAFLLGVVAMVLFAATCALCNGLLEKILR